MEFSLPISSKTVERFACDCSLSRVLLQDSLVIDVGRSKRTAGAPVRRALDARDGHCRWPGCERPAKWSAAHHVVHWIHGGATELDNLVLLCHRHHRMVHEGGWQVVKSDDGQLMTIPPTNYFPMQGQGSFVARPRGPD
jgi:HNH endonuclease